MLIQYLGGAGTALLAELALGPGSAVLHSIGLGRSAGLFAFDTLPEPLEINYFPHTRFPVIRKNRREATISGRCGLFAKPFFGSMARRWPTRSFSNRPVNRYLAPTKNRFCAAKGFAAFSATE